MNVDDILNSSGDELSGDMENMDVTLNYENADLMSSEFFDSALSMENLEDAIFSKFDDDVNLSSDASHIEDVLSPESYYSESDKNSYSTENTDESASALGSIDSFEDPLFMSLLETVPNNIEVKTEEMPVQKSIKLQNQKPTQILIQNPSNKKFIAKPIINATHFKKSHPKTKHQILNIQQVSNNGRPVLLPLSVKSIKILNASADMTALTGNFKRRKLEGIQNVISISEDDDTNVVSSTNHYPPLNLTNEEKRLLSKEGIQLPSHHPLTKNEERELKRIRRKIRNKISAQDSRKRKKEYVDGLEERVKRGSEENKNLLQRVRELQRQNRTLLAHVNKLQALICNSTSTKATPSTCLMVVLLSALLVSLPNMRLFESKQISTEQEQVSIRRSLLSSVQATEDDLNMEEFLIFKDEDTDFESKFADIADIDNSTEKELSKILEEVGKKYDTMLAENNSSDSTSVIEKLVASIKRFLDKDKPKDLFEKPPDFGGYHNKKGFIEPDIDDYIDVDEVPPIKKMKTYLADDNPQVVTTTVNKSGFGSKNK